VKHRGSKSLITSAMGFVFSPLSVCLSVDRITYRIFTKFYGMILHHPRTNQLEVKVTRGKKQNRFFAHKSVQNCRSESRQKLKCSLFNSLNISKQFQSPVEVGGVRRHDEVGYKSKKYNFGQHILLNLNTY